MPKPLRYRVLAAVTVLLLPTALAAREASARQETAAPDAAQSGGAVSGRNELLALARAALQRGDDPAAIELTTEVLEGAPDDARALLARSLAHYRLDDLGAAEADLSAALTAHGGGGAATGASIRWPDDFLGWVATVRAAYSSDSALPDISLDSLNAAAPARPVTAHFVMDVEVVRIPVIVENAAGGFLGGLDKDDFGVVDGEGLARPVRELIPENEPTSIGILLDASTEMSELRPEVIHAVTRLLEALQPEDEIFLAQYSGQARFLSDFSADRVMLATAMAGYESGPGRVLHDAIAMGLIRMRSARHEKKALIVIADGDDVSSQTSEKDLLVAARREGVAVHALLMIPRAQRWRPTLATDPDEAADSVAAAAGAVAAGQTSTSTDPEDAGGEEAASPPPTGQVEPGNAGVLQQIAHNTGGLVALRPAAEGQFGGLSGWVGLACRDLSDYINNQYLILFRSTNPPRRGVWRELRVEVGPRHERVRARSGYVR